MRPARHHISRATGAVIAVAALSGSAAAQDGPFAGGRWLPPSTSEYSIGVMNGKAQEFVYNSDGSKLSQLDWTFDNVVMFNAATTWRLTPWLRLGLKGSMNLSDGATMDDYDFNVFGCPGNQCESNHPGTRLRQAALFDVYGSLDVIRHAGFTASVLAGYKRDFYSWQAVGGTANYAILPDGYGISYEQTWSTPYIGIAFTASRDAWTLRGRLIGSTWAKGEGRDDHHLRSLTFKDDYSDANMVNAEVGVAYRVNSYVSITADYRYQLWGTGKGPTTIVDRLIGDTSVIPGDAAGGSAESHMFSLGLKVSLQPEVYEGGSSKDGPVVRPAVWSGWSIGIAGGPDWQRSDWNTTGLTLPPSAPILVNADTASTSFDHRGARVGLFLGHAWQHGQFVFGVEGDIGRSNAGDWKHGIPGTGTPGELAAATDSASIHSGYDGSLRLRAGMLMTPSLLVYATGGLAFQEVKVAASCPNEFPSWCIAGDKFEEASKVRMGWTAGLGYELAFAGNWFTRGEYRYTSIASFDHTFFAATPVDAVTVEIEPSSHRLTFGLGYRF